MDSNLGVTRRGKGNTRDYYRACFGVGEVHTCRDRVKVRVRLRVRARVSFRVKVGVGVRVRVRFRVKVGVRVKSMPVGM